MDISTNLSSGVITISDIPFIYEDDYEGCIRTH